MKDKNTIKNHKEVKEYGNSLVIIFDKEDCAIHHIKKGTIVDISDLVIVKNGEDKNARNEC